MSIRTEKVAELVKHNLSAILLRHLDTGTFGFVTITDVRMSADLKIANVFVSIFHAKLDKAQALKKINDQKREIRMDLGHSLTLKFTPDIQFHLDETLDRVEHLEELFRKIHEDGKQNADE
jgi:ribosome-binding factor A